jgi:Ribonuclease G/E
VKEDEANFKAQAEAQKTEIEDLRRQLAEVKEKCALAQANQEISEYWKNHLEKNVEELRTSKERCFEKSLDSMNKIKASFAKVGAYSTEENFIRGDPEGVVEWISGEAETFEEILSDHGDVCAFSSARGISAILEKVRCDHIKTMAQVKAAFSVDDTKDPSAEATLMGRKFYNDVWLNSGREMAHEIIKKSEKDSHDARGEARRAEEAAEREKRIGIIFGF